MNTESYLGLRNMDNPVDFEVHFQTKKEYVLDFM
jgi:hypothetical protein